MNVEGLLSLYGSVSNDLPESLKNSVVIAIGALVIIEIIARVINVLSSPAFINSFKTFFHWLDQQHRTSTQSPIDRPRLRLTSYLLSLFFSYLMSAFMLFYGTIFFVLLALTGPTLPFMNLLMLACIILFFIYGSRVYFVQGDNEWLRFRRQLGIVRCR